jgi:tRNA-uridine 2-sulfurtransferase
VESPKKKVFVGLSGGVDSSVSAALLKDAGYEVTGVFIRGWYPDWIPCTWREDRRDAMRVCARLGIPFLTMDLEAEYKRDVVDYLISEYRAGRTPNPDVMCNKYVKFGGFLKKALQLGADMIATGHYARVEHADDDADFRLLTGADTAKDQSYFLWTLNQGALSQTLFPVGHMTKPEVRALAERYNLPTASKPDSQGICFIGEVDMQEFLGRYIEPKRGNLLDTSGTVIGHHDGAWLYTIGERRGFTVTAHGTSDKPRYVVAKDVEANTVTVSEERAGEDGRFSRSEAALTSVNWVSGTAPTDGRELSVRLRYRGPLVRCAVAEANSEATIVRFDEPQAGVASGQSAVFYKKDVCLGGGVII